MKTGKIGNMPRLELEEVTAAVVEAVAVAGGEATLTWAGVVGGGDDDDTGVVFTTVTGETCCDAGCCWFADFACGGDAVNRGRRPCKAFKKKILEDTNRSITRFRHHYTRHNLFDITDDARIIELPENNPLFCRPLWLHKNNPETGKF